MEHLVGPLKLRSATERLLLTTPFRISGFTWEFLEVLVVSVEMDGHVGLGEAAGVYYLNDRPASMLAQITRLKAQIELGFSHRSLQTHLPPGGARNALDCALWDLESKLFDRPAWKLAGLQPPKPVVTTFTCGADTPAAMAANARAYTHARAIKLKLTGEPADADRVKAVRDARPDVWLAVDANQGFTRQSMDSLMNVLLEAEVKLLEQPFPRGHEHLLDHLRSPIPVGADESVQTSADLPALVGRVEVINIKLDKCGGLTEALVMAHAAKQLGFRTMVGNMLGSSLAMAPAFLIGQLCDIVDLDGPVFLKGDRDTPVQYKDGYVSCPEALWGYGAAT